jgi:intein-encoded DNA endonuclease-like protein
MKKINITKEMLENAYKITGSLQKTADKLNISVDSVSKYMKLYGISYIKNNHPKTYTCNEELFATDCEASMYLAGFIAADGSVQNRQYSKILKITLSKKDANHVEKIKQILQSNHPIKNYTDTDGNHSTELQICSSKICKDLLRFNIVPDKTFIYTFPEWLIEQELVRHFMRGYVDGDGSFMLHKPAKNRQVHQLEFNLRGTQDFLEKFAMIIEKQCNISAFNRVKKYDSTYSISYCGNKMTKIIHHFLYDNSTIYLDRKYQKVVIEY